MSREIDRQLCYSAEHGNVGEIERLIAAGANPNAFDGTSDRTPLQRAAENGHVAAIAALQKAGAHVDGASRISKTPLMLAALDNRTIAIEALIAAGADVHRCDLFTGNTALHLASAKGNLDAARVLLEAGAKADVLNEAGERPIDMVRGRRDRDRSCDVV